MSPGAAHRPIASLGALCVPLVLAGLAARGRGEPPARAPLTQQAKAAPTPAYVSAKRCNPCHDRPKELTSKLVALNEYPTWAEQDPHSKAHARLSDERSKRMARLLWQSDSAERKECLSCHGPGFAFQPEGETLALATEGVSCVACHGAFQEWVGAHWLDKGWTKLAPTVKEAEYGLADLRDPSRQAKLCVSCHVGNAAEGKTVTHAMYAAGHPPLPGIEVSSFAQNQPPHWWRPEQVPLFREQPALRPLFHYNPAELSQTRLLIEGTVAALGESMALLEAEMKGRATTDAGAEAPQPEFARFDCYACHHDLRPKGWRPLRGFPGTPGRVPLPTWPDALVRLAIEAAAPDAAHARAERDRFDRHTRALGESIASRQYGDPERTAAAAGALRTWAERLLGSFRDEKTPRVIDRALGERLERTLCGLALEGTPDYDSARQMAWALRVIHGELNPPPAGDPEVESSLKALDSELGLDLRAGSLKPIEESLPERLRRLADYDPQQFQSRMRAISARLAAQAAH